MIRLSFLSLLLVAALAASLAAATDASPEARIDQLGGRVTRDASGVATVVDLRNTPVEKEDVARLAELPGVKKLVLWGPAIGDDALPALKDYPALVDLTLQNTSVTDEGVRHLQAVEKLRSLSLNGSSGITNQAANTLAEMRDLTHISLP